MLTAGQYGICDACAPAVNYGDMSGIEYPESLATVEAFMESAGLIAHTGTYENGGYWTCDACGDVTIGNGSLFEGVL